MYFIADFTVGTMGDLLGFKEYVPTSFRGISPAYMRDV